MSGRWAASVVLLAVAMAAGCTPPGMVTCAPPAPRRDAFVYKPLEAPRPRPARIEASPPLALEIPRTRLEPPAPPAEAGWAPEADERPWRWIVIHHSATDTGSAAAFDAFHRGARQWDELGYHFVIGNGGGSADGHVEVGSRWPKQKWGAHCRVGDNEEYNYFGIGICLVGNFDNRRPGEAQMAALARLVDYLSHRYKILDAHIIGHGTVGDTRCPGRMFPMNDLLARVRRLRAAREALGRAG
ncbi:MAG: N-acetylmuramoyl-L-alanine amidase [Planctomycetes bacterium]|nr:N-acetylmuramoyl-L-alanine amidase [Planctomycetota bacterium]